MTDILVALYFTNTMLCLLLGVHWSLSTALRPLAAKTLGANYLLYAWQNALSLLVLGYAWPPALVLRPISAMLLGPALYLYYLTVAGRHPAFGLKTAVHAVPAAIMAGLILSDYQGRSLIDAMIITSFVVYMALISYPLIRGPGVLAHLGESARLAYRWFILLAIFLLLDALVELAVHWEVQQGVHLSRSRAVLIGAVLFLVFLCVNAFWSLRRSPLLEWMNSLGAPEREKWRSAALEDAQVNAIFDRWARLVRERALHKESGITLKRSARMLGVPVRRLSQAINRIYGSSFSQYLNDYRVAEAQRLLRDHPHAAITDLMLEAGFETKSSFHKEFRRRARMTPSEYRQSARPEA